MTPVPLELPLRSSEAAELARIVFELAEKKPLSAEVRNRVGGRAAALKFQTIAPYAGSLARDPVHHSTYYMAIDAGGAPYLLHMARASAPTSAIFPRPLLIGRMRIAAGLEIVINAAPFGPADTAALDAFATQVDSAFLPRPHGARLAIVAANPLAGFEAFRAIFKRTGKNVASFEAPYYETVWAAIRAGWRDGYSMTDPAREPVKRFPRYSRFLFAAPVAGILRLSAQVREARAVAKVAGPFDLGISFNGPPEELAQTLAALRDAGHAAQIAALQVDPAQTAAMAAAARPFGCSLWVEAAQHTPPDLRALARETGGRLSCVAGPTPIEELAEVLL